MTSQSSGMTDSVHDDPDVVVDALSIGSAVRAHILCLTFNSSIRSSSCTALERPKYRVHSRVATGNHIALTVCWNFVIDELG